MLKLSRLLCLLLFAPSCRRVCPVRWTGGGGRGRATAGKNSFCCARRSRPPKRRLASGLHGGRQALRMDGPSPISWVPPLKKSARKCGRVFPTPASNWRRLRQVVVIIPRGRISRITRAVRVDPSKRRPANFKKENDQQMAGLVSGSRRAMPPWLLSRKRAQESESGNSRPR